MTGLAGQEEENKEGFVVGYESGLRPKIKLVEARKLGSRKEQAELIRATTKYPGVAFAMLDSKDYKKLIWDLVRPVTAKPFTEEA